MALKCIVTTVLKCLQGIYGGKTTGKGDKQEAGKDEPILVEEVGIRTNRDAGGGAFPSVALCGCAVRVWDQ